MDKQELISEIIKLDRQIQRVIRRHSADAWMGLNLTVPQIKTLFFVSNQRGTNPTKLATALGVTPPNVTGIVDRLVEQGLLVRQNSTEDRRALVLHITEKGESVLSGLRERRTGAMREILECLDAGDLSLLAKGLSKLAGVTQAYKEKNSSENDRH
jgi:DNA-binding MarR family transcriptional regulator